MLKLSDREWKEFRLGDLFTIVTGKAYNKNKMNIADKGLRHVQRATSNHGIDCYAAIEDVDNYVRYKGNCITVSSIPYVDGTCAFYQDKVFCCGVGVNILTNDRMNRELALFMCNCINNAVVGKYGMARSLGASMLSNEILSLPVNDQGQPDYNFMEQYIREREPDYSWATGCVKPDAQLSLRDRQWKEFNLGDLFKVEQGKGKIDKDTLSSNNTGYKIATASTTSNGIIWSNAEQNAKVRAGNTITIGRQTGVAFYQPDKYFETDNILILTNSSINKWSGLFIAGSYNNSTAQKFSYGRVASIGKIKAESIKLPADDQGQPDYNFMERYMKSLPFSAAVA